MEGTMMHQPLLVDALLERAGTLFPRVEVVSRMADRSLVRHDYARVLGRARRLASALTRAGLRSGDRVATLMWNHHAHLETYFGVPMAGGVYHTLNLRLAPDELAFIVGHARDRFLVVDDVLLPLFARFADRVKLDRVFVVSLTGRAPEQHEPYEALLETGDEGFRGPPREENDAAGLCYTSGTTGKPKGVLYSHRAIVLHSLAAGLVDSLAICQADVMLPVVPMFHANAWGLPFTGAMVGCKQVFPGPHLDPAGLLDLYVAEKVSVSAGVPTIWLGILQELEKSPQRWALPPGLRMVVGGSAAPESMIRAFDRHGLRVVHAWGMTETTPLGSVATLKAHLADAPEDERYRLRAKQGLPAPLVDIRAVSDTGPVPWDGCSMGELQVRGPWVAASYFDAPEAAGCWTEDGWFRTGDVVTIDAEGYVNIADRTKDLIKSGGEWISSVALENALMGHPAVREAAVIAIPDEKWGERPLAVIVFKEGKTVEDAALREHLSATFPKWALPDRFVARAEIPRTSTGKFLKSKLREELGQTPNRS
jgi:fatty-acyl-CoA synthase